ncbi:MAG: hypothetical protein NUV65_06210 [Candidatus Roizmanbacteria bacterium]|nr:hypothetical protein [Candidatus Roizmanbacteria bacterium]
MISLTSLRNQINTVVVIGMHQPIIQSILDFDYYAGKKEPSITFIVTGNNGYEKFFWGNTERLIETTKYISKATHGWFLNVLSGRRALSIGSKLMQIPSVYGGVFFAENVPEQHALTLFRDAQKYEKLCIGPSSVGLLVPGYLKLGPIGGITPEQVEPIAKNSNGEIAILCGSGGMTNELIHLVSKQKFGISFALSFGGDRFPLTTPQQAFLLAQNDPQTRAIVYYGELGGEDEYEIAALKKRGELTKPVIMHISGTVAHLFPQNPQFGHAKAKASVQRETAVSKRSALKEVGFMVTERFSDVSEYLSKL